MLRRAALIVGVFALVLSALPDQVLAQEEHPFQIAFIGPSMQLIDDDATIKGIRLNLPYGVNENVWGLDAGAVNHVRGSAKAWQVGLVNLTEEDFTGWQKGFVNLSPGQFLGFQFGFVNHAGSGEGFQLGFVNHAQNFDGLQISVINFAEEYYGIQVGLINIIRSKDRFPILPIVNWKLD